MRSYKASAVAHSNIALIKYWGKEDNILNIPAVGSISITLNELYTSTSIQFDNNLKKDELVINDIVDNSVKTDRVSAFLDLIRKSANTNLFARINTYNNFPTGAGLASSASGFAALAVATNHALHLDLSKKELSILARQGSGSAARSIFGGFVKMNKSQKNESSDSFAEQLADNQYWDINLLILITSQQEKKTGSTAGMNHTKATSPFYKSWIDSSDNDLNEMEEAIQNKDFEKTGELTEHSAIKMHALTLSARPSLIYWNPVTLGLIHEVRNLRQKGIQCYVTIDAGPQIKILCLPENSAIIKNHFNSYPGVQKIISCRIGPDAHINKDEN